ncbi:hypothetical protein BH708_02080 [Brachybacterium sp. P6-10-X1]|uniref:hypothetical protein n=1 Tax=Brachybacterium sp. P6-10-X1 TaxID=1903186 RepID=UPI000971A150|nr:hypothetical protein [Brachybacterium sp. P6-10-X1]APX31707.1 hypothetical protein BH708_02080 [Brachybacterium sp. P6-10-X1]
MPAAPRDTIFPLVIGGAASTALGMIPLHRLPHPVQIGYVVLPAAFAAAVTYAAQRTRDRRQPGEAPAPPPAAAPVPAAEDARASDVESCDARPWVGRLGLSLGVGAVVAGAGAGGIWIDHRVENVLRSLAVPAPRLVMGIAGGIITTVLAAGADSEDSDGPDDSGWLPWASGSTRPRTPRG